jgi:hypothetical protein
LTVIYGPRSRARANPFWRAWGINTVAVIYTACKSAGVEVARGHEGNPRTECLIIP